MTTISSEIEDPVNFVFTDYEMLDNYEYDYCYTIMECHEKFSPEGWQKLCDAATELGLNALKPSDNDTLVCMSKDLFSACKDTRISTRVKLAPELDKIISTFSESQGLDVSSALSIFVSLGIQTVFQQELTVDQACRKITMSVSDLQCIIDTFASLPKPEVQTSSKEE